MGQKDITERILESYNDVFADIVNVLLFRGERIINPEDLTDHTETCYYKVQGQIHAQERDIAKRWTHGAIRVSCLGIENQTCSDADMPLRVMNYDAADYRAQLLENNNRERHAVVTLVLYYGYKAPWNAPRNLKNRIYVPDILDPYVNDYRINLFQIAYLTREQIDMFQSDFRIIADYFSQRRENRDYVPNTQMIQHVEAVLDLLRVFENDQRFDDIYNDIIEHPSEGGITTMCDVLDRAINQGREEGHAAGLTEGREEGHAAGLTEGREEGHAAGRKEGREEGLAVGRKEGERSERQRSIRTMHIQGVGAEDIARFLQLDLSYVQGVLEQND